MRERLVKVYIRHKAEQDLLASELAVVRGEILQATGERRQQLLEALEELQWLYAAAHFTVRKLLRDGRLRRAMA